MGDCFGEFLGAVCVGVEGCGEEFEEGLLVHRLFPFPPGFPRAGCNLGWPPELVHKFVHLSLRKEHEGPVARLGHDLVNLAL